MSDDQIQTTNNDELPEEISAPEVDETAQMEMLKSRAKLMGIKFSNNIGLEALKKKVRDKMEGISDDESEDAPAPNKEAPLPMGETVKQKAMNLRQYMIKRNMRLVRLRITCLDPKKKDLHGEIITVANEHLGTVRKFVPFGEVTDNGYHVPYCIYRMLDARKFLNIRTYKDRKNNNQIKVEQVWAKEFSLEVLPPLTKEEIAKLAAAQSAAGGVD